MRGGGGGRGGGGQAYKVAAYYRSHRSQTSVDKGNKGVDFSLRLNFFCGFAVSKENNLEKSFHLLLTSSDKTFPGVPVIASAGFTRRPHRFALFSLGRATEKY